MACACSGFGDAAERHFTAEMAAKELDRYHARGIDATTRQLRDAVVAAGLNNGTVLDVGCGIGALTFELLARGAEHAVAVDAAAAYAAAATSEAERRGLSGRVRVVHADFVSVADDLPSASTVTLNRVVCCYPAYEPLLTRAVRHAERGLAYSYPRERWLVRVVTRIENALRRRTGSFRTYVHPAAAMERLILQSGFELVARQSSLVWAVDVFVRR